MFTELDKEVVKTALRELIKEDPVIIKNALKEINDELQIAEGEFEKMMSKNFEKYSDTF